MRFQTIAAAVAAAFLAAPALAAGYSCEGAADPHGGVSVNVTFAVDASGAITSRSAEWRPGGMAAGLAALLGAEPTLIIGYAHPTEADIGPATSVSGFSLLSEKRDTLSGMVLALILDGDGTHEWSVKPVLTVLDTKNKKDPPMTMASGTLVDSDASSSPVNTDLLVAIEKAKTARMGFRNGNQIIGGVADTDLTDRTGRDVAFHKAWTAAAKAAAKWKRCDKAE